MKGCGKRFIHKFWGERICGRFEDLKHSDHYIYCEKCSHNLNKTNGCGKEIQPHPKVKMPCGEIAGGEQVYCEDCESQIHGKE